MSRPHSRHAALREALRRADEAVPGLGTSVEVSPTKGGGVAAWPREYLHLLPKRTVPLPYLVTANPPGMETRGRTLQVQVPPLFRMAGHPTRLTLHPIHHRRHPPSEWLL